MIAMLAIAHVLALSIIIPAFSIPLHPMYLPSVHQDILAPPKPDSNISCTRASLQRSRRYYNQSYSLAAASPPSYRPRKPFNLLIKRAPTPVGADDPLATPAPTGDPSPKTTVHITDENNFSLIVPEIAGEVISDAESDGVSFCTSGAAAAGGMPCSQSQKTLPEGYITAAAVQRSVDNKYIQITGCLNSSKFTVPLNDDGGQFDVRYHNGAQCTFGGYGASFIEQIEPSTNRFCLRCCSSLGDQVNCNSHNDRAGCLVAIPGQYDFPDQNISCA